MPKRQNLTQAELAERAELSLDSIKRIESGKRTMSLENFLRLNCFDISMSKSEGISLALFSILLTAYCVVPIFSARASWDKDKFFLNSRIRLFSICATSFHVSFLHKYLK